MTTHRRKKSLVEEFEGEVLEGRESYEICNEVGDGFTELKGILKKFCGKKVRITLEEI